MKINNDILLLDNFLSDDQISLVKKSIIKDVDYILDDPNILKGAKYKRIFLDGLYNNRRYESSILRIMDNELFSSRVLKETRDMDSYPFSTLPFTTHHETQLTVYENGGRYSMHRDNNYGRLLSFILPIIMDTKKYEGGELHLIHNRKPILITPKHNQLILFSGHLYHKVLPIKTETDNLLDGRIVINGHIGY